MPKTKREKYPDAVYHVMSRSISERDLFQDDSDKDYYLKLLKRYKDQFHCYIYAYILMDNHVHLYIDPNGSDISKFMLCLNSAYVRYFNDLHGRHGHLFQGRFGSKTVDDNQYALSLMAYIHNNASDLPGYAGREETYIYSSYGVYSGHRNDDGGITDPGYILNIFNSSDTVAAKRKCTEFVCTMRGCGLMKEVDENILRAYVENEYRDDRKLIVRDAKPGDMIKKITGILGERTAENLRAKHIRETSETRAFVTYVLRVLCGFSYRMICEYMGNMSLSGISRLFREGFRLVGNNQLYRNAFNALMT